jgi:RNA polymerase sigma factor (sigma-70 family)
MANSELWRLALRPALFNAAAVSDTELLTRFQGAGDPAAFELLVYRHGPMVWGACRRILGSHHAAEDAFQATFLALTRRSGRIRESVPGWLHRVAVRASLDLLRRNGPSQLPRQAPDPVDSRPGPLECAVGRELATAIDVAVNQLPERLRVAYVLCDLHGHSLKEAAAQLACPIGTVESRLARARGRLRDALVGFRPVVGGALAAGAVPRALQAATVRAALGRSAVRPALVALASRAAGAANWGRVVPAFATSLGLALLVAAVAVGQFHTPTPVTANGKSLVLAGSQDTKPAPQKVKGASQADDGNHPIVAIERFRHEGEAVALEFSPDGTVLASYFYGPQAVPGGPPDTSLNLFSAITGEHLGKVRVAGQGQCSRPFAFSPDGKFVAVVDLYIGKAPGLPGVLICDPVTGKVMRTLSLRPPGPVGPVLLRFSPDGKLLAVAVTCNIVWVLDPVTGKFIHELGAHPNSIFSLAFSPNNKTLAVGTSKPSLEFWDTETGKQFFTTEKNQQGVVTSVAYSTDGALVAEGSHGHAIILRDATTGGERRRLDALKQTINGLAFFADGQKLVSEGNGKVRVWDLRTGKEELQLDGAAEGRSLALSPDGRAVALGTRANFIVWDLPYTVDDTRAKEASLSATELKHLWAALGQDALEAQKALRTLRGAAGGAVTFLRDELRPAAMPDAETVKRPSRTIR